MCDRTHLRPGAEPCRPNRLMVVSNPHNVMEFGRKKGAKPRVKPQMQRKIFNDHKMLWGLFASLDWAEQSLIDGYGSNALTLLRSAREQAIKHAEDVTGMVAEETSEGE